MKKIAIIGGGISGLTTAYFLLYASRLAPYTLRFDITVFESENRTGGKIWTDKTGGFLCEKGPNGFLDNKPKTLELCQSLGIKPLRSNENAKKRFIFSQGKLNALPESPPAFLKSDLITWHGKLRFLYETQNSKLKTQNSLTPAPTGTLTSFYDGLQTITEMLSEKLGDKIKLGASVKGIERLVSSYLLHTSSGAVEADIVVLAVPAYTGAELLRDFDKELSITIARIPYASVSVVCFGYKKEKVGHALNGFGFLIPHKEGRKILGTLWDSSVFPNRAPEGHVLLRSMAGGAKTPELAMLDDGKLINTVFDELKEIVSLKAEPDMLRIYRWDKAIPQYVMGHRDILDTIDKRLQSHPGLYLTGNAYRGVGMNDCIENSYKVAGEIADRLISIF
ncbi:MAG: protoporphyrinogen oxidase [Nitrospirae bacterium]|nr:protoporphyrinogen oxidase [Nitrospirota bacterium]